jgi:UDP-N-acetylmuramoylalanine--D-glutamate ligase
MADTLDGSVPTERVDGTFEDALNAALTMSMEGDLLLLSPACSSFDMFRNYVERGLRFSAFARGEA